MLTPSPIKKIKNCRNFVFMHLIPFLLLYQHLIECLFHLVLGYRAIHVGVADGMNKNKFDDAGIHLLVVLGRCHNRIFFKPGYLRTDMEFSVLL